MMRRYAILAVGAAAVGVLLTVAGRHPHAARRVPAPIAPPVAEVALVVAADGVHPPRSQVASGSRVGVAIENRTGRTVSVALAGYEDQLRIDALAPGRGWRGAFLADRPGEDFAWLVDGAPAGRLSVTGSHLVDGHR